MSASKLEAGREGLRQTGRPDLAGGLGAVIGDPHEAEMAALAFVQGVVSDRVTVPGLAYSSDHRKPGPAREKRDFGSGLRRELSDLSGRAHGIQHRDMNVAAERQPKRRSRQAAGGLDRAEDVIPGARCIAVRVDVERVSLLMGHREAGEKGALLRGKLKP